MKGAITSFWRYGTCFCCIEMTTLNGQNQFYGISLKKRKEEYTQPEYFQADSVGGILKQLKKNQHLQLIINSDQVLIKEVTVGLTVEKAVSMAFPSVSSNNFYFELYDTGKVAYVAISKRAYVDGVLESFRYEKHHVINFRLGFGSLQNLASILKTERIATAKRNFNLKDGHLILDEGSEVFESSYEIAGFLIEKQFVLPLAGSLNYDIEIGPEQVNYKDFSEQLKSEYSAINTFNKVLFSGIGLLLLLLLVNFFLFSNYYNTHEGLKAEIRLLESKANIYNANFEKVKLKEHRVENMFNGGNSESSLYFNRLVQNKPESILLIELHYQPLLKKIKANTKIEYAEKQIIIGGESADKESFSDWIEDLESYDWISEVAILTYGSEGNTMDVFKILIRIADATEN